MIRIKALDHVVLRVSDMHAMIRFYCDVLGCNVERELPPEFGLVQLRAGNALIDLVSVDGELGRSGGAAPGKEGRNMDHFCVSLENFDEAEIRHHLSGFAIQAGTVETRYGAEGSGPSIYIQDPENNIVELKGPPY
jgi:glyoxylase I family protein